MKTGLFALAAVSLTFWSQTPAMAQNGSEANLVVSSSPPQDLNGGPVRERWSRHGAVPTPEIRHDYELIRVTRDAERIATFLVDHAKRGNIWAMRKLGAFYSGSSRLANDPEKSLYWYHEAAVLGDAPSALVVGSAFARGVVVEQEEKLARFWLARAAEGGDWRIKRDAKELLASL